MALPPDNSIPNSSKSAKGVNVTCGVEGGGGIGDCSVGIHISNENGVATSPVFNTAEYIQLYRQYGLFIEAMPSGIQTSAVIKNNGNGLALQLQTTGALTPNNAVLGVIADGVTRYSVRQNGDVYSQGHWVTIPASRPTISACGTSPSIASGSDTAGRVVVGGGTVTSCRVNFARSFTNIPACVISREAGMAPLWLADASFSYLVASTSGGENMAGFNFDYICIDQQ